MDRRAEAWYRRRTSRWVDWPLTELLERKQRDGVRISVVAIRGDIPPARAVRGLA